MTARPLSIWDAGFCWRLARDQTVRDSAHSTRKPTLFGHLLWMARWLFKMDRQAWVVAMRGAAWVVIATGEPSTDTFWEGETAGLVRCERGGVVSIEVLPEHRGKGVGIFGVRIATEFILSHGWGTPVAHIRAHNGPSIALFAKAGYEMTGAIGGWVRMERAA